MVKRVSNRPTVDLGVLDPEDIELLQEARESTEVWIDEKVDELVDSMKASVEQAASDLAAEVEHVENELQASRKKMEELQHSVQALKLDLDLGDGKMIEEAVNETEELVSRVHAELDNYERRWRGLGQGIVNTGINAAKKIITGGLI